MALLVVLVLILLFVEKQATVWGVSCFISNFASDF